MQAPRTVSGRLHQDASATHAQDELELGDTVEVPGGNRGIVKFIGSIEGKNGLFAGVELGRESAAFGKNNGDVDGVQYFTCAIPGAGIFLPTHRATKVSMPRTPSMKKVTRPESSLSSFRSPPSTPSLPSFSQSVGPGARHPSAQMQTPQTRGKSRPSLPRPGSPSKAPIGRPSIAGLRGPSSPAVSRAPTKPSTPIPMRTQSRTQSRLGNTHDGSSTPVTVVRPGAAARTISTSSTSRPDEARNLRAQLEERDKQLAGQAASIAEMESALTELQAAVDANTANGHANGTRDNMDSEDSAAEVTRLRALLDEKNDRIASLTADFDSHRRDFRETITALESASSETKRVYEAKLRQVSQDADDLRASHDDLAARAKEFAGSREEMETVAEQLSQLEELVQELEEGLDDSRRNEAEAKRRVEELEGEVERGRIALEQERSRYTAASSTTNEDENTSRLQQEKEDLEAELQRRDDELKELGATFRQLELNAREHDIRSSEKVEELVTLRTSLQSLEQQNRDLTSENDALQEELEDAKQKHADLLNSSRDRYHSPTRTPLTSATLPPFGRDSPHAMASILNSRHIRGPTETSGAADLDGNNSLYCDLCEEEGHDVLSCTVAAVDTANHSSPRASHDDSELDHSHHQRNDDFLSSQNLPPLGNGSQHDKEERAEPEPQPAIVYDPNDTGPAPGKQSGKIDTNRWCAFCERSGHESLDCPFEEEL